MDISPKEVESVKIIGRLFDNDVKIVKTFGGFNIAVGKKSKHSAKAEALAGGSHQAIISHQLSKEFGSDFQPAIFKSEQDKLATVEEKSQHLPSDQIEQSVGLFVLTKNNKIDFVLDKRGVTLGRYVTEVDSGKLVIKSYHFNDDLIKSDKRMAEALSKAMKDKMYELNLSQVIVQN